MFLINKNSDHVRNTYLTKYIYLTMYVVGVLGGGGGGSLSIKQP